MLFVIIHKHTAEMCPAGVVRINKDWLKEVTNSFKNAKIKYLGGYANSPNHEFFFIIEADDLEEIDNAIEPLRRVGKVRIIPVLKFEEIELLASGRAQLLTE